MSDPIIGFVKRLKQSNFSVTRPRLAIFQALQNNEPLSLHELIAACGPGVDRASIYRTIALFERLGVVQRLQIGWKYKIELSNRFQPHHHHATCTLCGSVAPLSEDKTIEKLLHDLSASIGFQTIDHQLELRGLCKSCS